MADKYYNRYKKFTDKSGYVVAMPFIKIREKDSDLHLMFDKQHMRLDNLSYKYYNDANFAWLILQANPELGGYEYAIPDGVDMRIPYPLDLTLSYYEQDIENYKKTH